MKWTPEQRRGIETTGRSLLVSAAAGSGKTAVLAQRCAHLVCEATPPCDIDQLLVVTFTEAAAAEMKGRIESVLRARLIGKEDDPRLNRQLALIERAQVSTLHGFCARLLRQNFHLLGLDPGFAVLDGDEARLLRIDTAREVFSARYENDAGGDFGRLVRFYVGGEDELLIPHVLRTHDMLCSQVDPRAWLTRARRRIEEGAGGRLEECKMGKELLKLVGDKIAALRRRCADAIGAIGRVGGLEKYVAYLGEIQALLDEWSDLLRSEGIDGLARAVEGLSLPHLPRVAEGTEGKALAVSAIDSIRDEMKKGALAQIARFSREQWQVGLRSMAPLAGVLLDLVEEFGERYARAKDEQRRLDFNDLERFALKILRDGSSPGDRLRPSPVARGFHKQFEHVLVDEYQDINEVQDAILHLVSRECVADQDGVRQNLFCVGDVKQSIYRFRLAEPERFLSRYERFKGSGFRARGSGGEVIDLQANFRSRAPLLEILNRIFVRLMTAEATDIEYDRSHHLHPGATFPDGDESCFRGAPVELHLLPEDVPSANEDEEDLDRSEREAQFVARRIREIMGLDGGGRRMCVIDKVGDERVARPIQFRDIVVLLRSMKFKADQYAEALRAAGIPVHREGGQGYFQSMEVRDMRALLTLLDNPKQDIPMAAVLRSPLAGLAEAEDCLARIRLAYPYNQEGMPFHEAVVRYAAERDDDLAAALRDFMEGKLHRWRQVARHRPLAELLREIYDDTGYLAFCRGLHNGEQRVANLLELHERAAQFGSFSRQGLYRFLKFLDSLEAETDFGQPSVLSEAADVVRIMSVHHSKGLEFPVVFLPELGKRINLQDCQGAILIDKRAGLGMYAIDPEKRIRYPSLASVLVQTSLRRKSLAEELRILYVALTRAKEHLILSGTCSDAKREQWRNLWRGHAGPMPADDILAASTMLDWIGPAVAMIDDDAAFRITEHTPEEVAQWSAADPKRPALSPRQETLARLEPLSPAPPRDDKADRLIAALTFAYPHAAAANLEAARSVTDWTKQGREAPVGYATASEEQTLSFDRTLATPRCLLDTNDLSAADFGTATHLVLQHLDFSRPCADEDLAAQVNELISRRLLTSAQARNVDLGAIEWFAGTDLAKSLAANAAHLRREMDFYLAVPPAEFCPAATSTDPLDYVMVRGRIDALLITPEVIEIIDYKTDRVAPEKIAERAAFYQPQVALYLRAVQQITGRTVQNVRLVFLFARVVVDC